MTTVNTYLTFNGNCEEAFNFYKVAFKSEIEGIYRFKDMPEDPSYKLNDEEMERVMHISLPIGKTMLMGSDTGGKWASSFKQGNNFSVSINTDAKDEADRLYQLNYKMIYKYLIVKLIMCYRFDYLVV